MIVYDCSPVRDEGTVIVWEGITEDLDVVWFGVDHGLAAAIPDGADCEVEPWQILARTVSA